MVDDDLFLREDGTVDGSLSNSGGCVGPDGGSCSSSSGGSGGGSSGGTPGDDAGGPTTNDARVTTVPGTTFPCGTNVCAPPNVCCEGNAGGDPPCEAQSACNNIAVACTASTCPSRSLCCGSLKYGGGGAGGVTGSTECQQASTCAAGTTQLCTTSSDCPTGDECVTLGGGAGGTFRVYEKRAGDGGAFQFDSGGPAPADAGGE